jgi:small-conductance mechanosensitive channel
VARIETTRDDARRVDATRRARVTARPVPVAAPLFAAVAFVTVAVIASSAVGVPIGEITAIAAAVAVVIAVIAHRTVRSVFAGIALLLIRPYAPGERLRLRSPGDQHLMDAEVLHIGLANSTLATGDGTLVVANHLLLGGVPAAARADMSP